MSPLYEWIKPVIQAWFIVSMTTFCYLQLESWKIIHGREIARLIQETQGISYEQRSVATSETDLSLLNHNGKKFFLLGLLSLIMIVFSPFTGIFYISVLSIFFLFHTAMETDKAAIWFRRQAFSSCKPVHTTDQLGVLYHTLFDPYTIKK